MSVNKILTLIGCILVSFLFGMAILMSYFAYSLMSSPPGSFFHVTPTPEFILMLIGLIVIPMALTIISWMAFAHLDKASEKRWKNYLLVEGGVLAFFFVLFMFQILASQYTDYFSFLIIVPLLASAVLFILAFALKPVVRK